jgi:hypothetical protein
VHGDEKRVWQYMFMYRSDPARLWNVIIQMQGNLLGVSGTVIICRNPNEVKRHSAHFSSIGQDYSALYIAWKRKIKLLADELAEEPSGSTEGMDGCEDSNGPARAGPMDPLATWFALQDHDVDLCVTTAASINGFHSVRRLLVVYTGCPTQGVFSSTYMDSNNNILICGPRTTLEERVSHLSGKFTLREA